MLVGGAASLREKLGEVGGFALATRPELETLVEHWASRVVLAQLETAARAFKSLARHLNKLVGDK